MRRLSWKKRGVRSENEARQGERIRREEMEKPVENGGKGETEVGERNVGDLD